jgi:hypothetical protein
MRAMALTLCGVMVLVSGCGNPERDKLERGVRFAKRTLEEVNRNPLASVSFSSQAELGGSLVTYLAANVPDNPSMLPRFDNDEPSTNWTVVLSWASETNVLIQGFGTDLTKPLVTATAYVNPLPVR